MISDIATAITEIARVIPDPLPPHARLAGRIAVLESLTPTRHRKRALARLRAELDVLVKTEATKETP